MRERLDTFTPNDIIALIKDVFDEDELNNFYNYVNENNDKEKAESIKRDMIKLLST